MLTSLNAAVDGFINWRKNHLYSPNELFKFYWRFPEEKSENYINDLIKLCDYGPIDRYISDPEIIESFPELNRWSEEIHIKDFIQKNGNKMLQDINRYLQSKKLSPISFSNDQKSINSVAAQPMVPMGGAISPNPISPNQIPTPVTKQQTAVRPALGDKNPTISVDSLVAGLNNSTAANINNGSSSGNPIVDKVLSLLGGCPELKNLYYELKFDDSYPNLYPNVLDVYIYAAPNTPVIKAFSIDTEGVFITHDPKIIYPVRSSNTAIELYKLNIDNIRALVSNNDQALQKLYDHTLNSMANWLTLPNGYDINTVSRTICNALSKDQHVFNHVLEDLKIGNVAVFTDIKKVNDFTLTNTKHSYHFKPNGRIEMFEASSH